MNNLRAVTVLFREQTKQALKSHVLFYNTAAHFPWTHVCISAVVSAIQNSDIKAFVLLPVYKPLGTISHAAVAQIQ